MVRTWSLPDGIEPTIESHEKHAVVKVEPAATLFEPEDEVKLSFADLIPSAEVRQERRYGKPYSGQWHVNILAALRDVDFSPEDLTPSLIRGYMETLKSKGLACKTILDRFSLLSGLITSAIKSGYRSDLRNAFKEVDYATRVSKHLYTATDEDYEAVKEVLPTWPYNQQLAIELMVSSGLRIGELVSRSREDLDGQWLQIQAIDTWLSKNDSSIREVPVPRDLADRLVSGWPEKWPVGQTLRTRIKTVNPELGNHSFRHGLKRVSRKVILDSVMTERLLRHSHGNEMESTYGGSAWPRESLLAGAQKIWNELGWWD